MAPLPVRGIPGKQRIPPPVSLMVAGEDSSQLHVVASEGKVLASSFLPDYPEGEAPHCLVAAQC